MNQEIKINASCEDVSNLNRIGNSHLQSGRTYFIEVMETIWKEISGFPDYLVSNKGGIMSIKFGNKRMLKPVLSDKGYYRIEFYKNKQRRRFLVHRLVCIAFLENPLNKATVNHIDGVKTNNNINNLEWATSLENIKHAYMTGLAASGEKHHSSKLTEKDVIDIRNAYAKGGVSYGMLARAYKVNHPAISSVIRGETWAHVSQTPNK